MKIAPLFLVTHIVLTGAPLAHADTWLRAEIYFVDWDVSTRTQLSPQRVRELADYKRTLRRDAPSIARLLVPETLKRTRDKQSEDARLVVDLYTDNFVRITYYASRFNLCNETSTAKRPVDEQFRQRFKRLAKGGRLTTSATR